jgi:hypothetical protein
MGYEVYESKAFKIIIQHDETQKATTFYLHKKNEQNHFENTSLLDFKA